MALAKLEPKDFMFDIPRWPDVPQAEWKKRINRAQELMAEEGIDLLLIWLEQNVRYFFGLQTNCWRMPTFQPAIGIIPATGEPVLAMIDTLLPNTQATSWVRNIWFQPNPYRLPEQRAFPKDVGALVRDLGFGRGNIALEMGPLGSMYIPRPLNDIEAFKAKLPNANFVNGDKVIWGCRMIKSPLEIERMKQAARVIIKMHSAVLEQFRPGMTEMDVAKIIHHVEVDSGDIRGGDSTLLGHIVCGREKEGLLDIMALEDVMITEDDYLQLSLQHRHKGYWAYVGRIFQVGSVTDKMKRNYGLAAAGVENAKSNVKPGVRCCDLYEATVKPIQEAGLLVPVAMAGHGMGMDILEPPCIDATNETEIQAGMVFSLESWILNGWRKEGGEGLFGYEEQFVCTADGYESIGGLDKSIIQVRYGFN